MQIPPRKHEKRLSRVVNLCLRSHAKHAKARNKILSLLEGSDRDETKALLLAELESNEDGHFLTPSGEWLPASKIEISHILAKCDGGDSDIQNLVALSERHNQVMSSTRQIGEAAKIVKKALEEEEAESSQEKSLPVTPQPTKNPRRPHIDPKTPDEIAYQEKAIKKALDLGIRYWTRRSQGMCAEQSSPECEGFIGYTKKAYCNPCLNREGKGINDRRKKSKGT